MRADSGADDLCPLFIAVLVLARPQHLSAAVAAVSDWSDARGVALGQLGWCLATLQMGAEFLARAQVEELIAGKVSAATLVAGPGHGAVTAPDSSEGPPTPGGSAQVMHERAVLSRFGLAATEHLVAGALLLCLLSC
jgi:hypothetical protein